MAAAQTLSPGGALLRASRMFSVPTPLPQPNSFSGFGSGAGTRAHPTHLTITTPQSSLNKGDWGLKRPLPLRSTTKTSTPLVRVTTMDTFEHVTEFESAADHTLTLKKWQDLHISLSTPKMRNNSALENGGKRIPTKSVFEEDMDYTASRDSKPGEDSVRWKFNGPWLAGQSELEFNDYLKKEVRRRKTEFHHFLREEYVRGLNSERREKERDGEEIPEVTLSDITEEQINTYLKELRNNRTILFRLIREFFDLPPAPVVKVDERVSQWDNPFQDLAKNLTRKVDDTPPESSNPYAFSGPPKTHPSGGISYLRTASHINNHPIFGPQEENTPVKGRVIMPREAAVGAVTPKLGIAGIAVNVPSGVGGFNIENLWRPNRSFKKRDEPLAGLQYIEPDIPGGSKVWAKINGANLDSDGRPNLWIGKPSEMAVLVAEGKAGNIEDVPVAFAERKLTSYTSSPSTTGGGGSGYGLDDDSPLKRPPGYTGTNTSARTLLKDLLR